MIKAKITRKDVKHHFDYMGWMYILVPIILVIFWSLVYTFSEYRPSDERILSLYMTASYADTEKVGLLAEEVAPDFPEMEELDFLSITVDNAYDYTDMQRLMTLIYAGQGDVYILDTEMFEQLVGDGAFMPLDGLVDTDIDLSPATLRLEGDEDAHVYGIPADSLYGLIEHELYDNRRTTIVIMAYTTNPDESVQLVQWLVDHRQGEAPANIDQWEMRQPFYPTENQVVIPTGDN
jgi:hypothetical protein